MNLRRIGWCLLFAALFTGCRKDAFVAQYIEQINNQNRELEDQQYELEYELDKLREENARLKENRTSTTKPSNSSSSGAGSLLGPPRNTSPLTKPPTMEPEIDGMDLEPPVIETPKTPGESGAKKLEVPPVGPLVSPKIELPNVPAPNSSRTVPRSEQTPATTSVRDLPAPRMTPSTGRPETKPELVAPKPTRPSLAPEELLPAQRPAIDFAPQEQEPAKELQLVPVAPENVEAEELPAPKRVVVPDSASSAPRGRPAWIEPPPVPPADLSPPLPAPETTPDITSSSRQNATRLFFNPEHTHGVNLDDRPGDDGLALLIEPQNGLGDYVPQVGKISVVLLDPALEGANARVARWDFDTEKVLAAQSVLASKRGISLTMPWPTAPPQHSTLRLFVRLETEAGEQLQADQELTVALPGQAGEQRAESWTPRPGDPNERPAGEVARRPASSFSPQSAPTPPASAKDLPAPPTFSVPPSNTNTPSVTIQEPAAALAPPASELEAKPFKSQMIVPPPALGELK